MRPRVERRDALERRDLASGCRLDAGTGERLRLRRSAIAASVEPRSHGWGNGGWNTRPPSGREPRLPHRIGQWIACRDAIDPSHSPDIVRHGGSWIAP